MFVELYNSIPENIFERVNGLELRISSPNCHHAVNSLLQKTVLMGGKRLRPLLTYLMGNLYGLTPEKLDTFAAAIEMVHAASLAHDDVIDNATQRRDQPSINTVSSNQKAVLAGDYLLADVIVKLSNEGNLTLVKEMSHIIQDLALGEWIQLDAIKERNYTHELIAEIALKKTSSVMSWCCVAPAYLANLSTDLISYSRKFGEHLGQAFQLMDDTLDFSGTSKKDHHLDLKNGVVNSVVYEWLCLNPTLKESYIKGSELFDIWNENHLEEAISIVHKRAISHIDEATKILDIIAREIEAVSTLEKNRIEESLIPIKMILKYLESRQF